MANRPIKSLEDLGNWSGEKSARLFMLKEIMAIVHERYGNIDYTLTVDNIEGGTLNAVIDVRQLNGKYDSDSKNKCDNCGFKLHSQRISQLPSCNDCAKKKDCNIQPPLGDWCRINCFNFERKERDQHGKEV